MSLCTVYIYQEDTAFGTGAKFLCIKKILISISPVENPHVHFICVKKKGARFLQERERKKNYAPYVHIDGDNIVVPGECNVHMGR